MVSSAAGDAGGDAGGCALGEVGGVSLAAPQVWQTQESPSLSESQLYVLQGTIQRSVLLVMPVAAEPVLFPSHFASALAW